MKVKVTTRNTETHENAFLSVQCSVLYLIDNSVTVSPSAFLQTTWSLFVSEAKNIGGQRCAATGG